MKKSWLRGNINSIHAPASVHEFLWVFILKTGQQNEMLETSNTPETQKCLFKVFPSFFIFYFFFFEQVYYGAVNENIRCVFRIQSNM